MFSDDSRLRQSRSGLPDDSQPRQSRSGLLDYYTAVTDNIDTDTSLVSLRSMSVTDLCVNDVAQLVVVVVVSGMQLL